MTPSEKKAREIFVSVLHHTVEEELWRIGDAIEVAERRGFERAKELAKQAMAPMLRDMISRGKAWDLIDGIKFQDEVSDGIRGGDIDP